MLKDTNMCSQEICICVKILCSIIKVIKCLGCERKLFVCFQEKKKSEDDLHKTFSSYFAIIARLMQNIMEKSTVKPEADSKTETETEMETESESEDDFQTLAFPAPQPSVVLSDVLDLILKHPLTMKLFLGQSSSCSSAEDREGFEFACTVFTTSLARLLSAQTGHEKVSVFLKQYLPSFKDELNQAVQKLFDGEESDLPEELVALSAMMLKAMDGQSFKEMSSRLFRVNVTLDGEDTGLTKLLYLILDKFSDPDVLELCDPTQFAHVAYSICLGSDSTLVNALVKLLEKKPLLLVSLDQRFLGEELRKTQGGPRVAELLVKASPAAQKWFEESNSWIEDQRVSLAYLQYAGESYKISEQCIYM